MSPEASLTKWKKTNRLSYENLVYLPQMAQVGVGFIPREMRASKKGLLEENINRWNG